MCDIDGCKSIDCARADLKKICKPEYANYIDKHLAGDFAVHIVLKTQRQAPCKYACESKAFEIEIKNLKGELIKHAAFIARELADDAITEAQHIRFHKLIQQMKLAAGSNT